MKTVALAGIVGGVAGDKVTQWIGGEGALTGAMLNPHSGGKSLVGGLKGYLTGMRLSRGEVKVGVGGLCQFGNLLLWMAWHSP